VFVDKVFRGKFCIKKLFRNEKAKKKKNTKLEWKKNFILSRNERSSESIRIIDVKARNKK
jgi:aspartyl/asparaginyl beta-hydroxylase (cupin superfamily)